MACLSLSVFGNGLSPDTLGAVKNDVNQAMAASSKNALTYALFFSLLGAVFSILLPGTRMVTWEQRVREEAEGPSMSPTQNV